MAARSGGDRTRVACNTGSSARSAARRARRSPRARAATAAAVRAPAAASRPTRSSSTSRSPTSSARCRPATRSSPDVRELLPTSSRVRTSTCATARRRRRPNATSPPRSPGASATSATSSRRTTARKLVFALREPDIVGAAPEDQPTWDIWEYDLDAQQLRRVITSDTAAREGHDVAPHYLPDGRIVFSSTRQRQSKAILLDEGKPQFEAQDESDDEPAFVLHVMNADGTGIHQVSFNQSHDLDPAVLPDGRVVFSRWDNAPGHDETQPVHDATRRQRPAAAVRRAQPRHRHRRRGHPVPRSAAAGERQAARACATVRGAGPRRHLLEVDTANFVENTQPTLPNRGALTGPGADGGDRQRRAHRRRARRPAAGTARRSRCRTAPAASC